MKTFSHPKMVLLLSLILLLSACNLPERPATVTESPQAAYTAAAETIVAQLTGVVPPATDTPAIPATQEPTSAPATATATLPPTATATPEPTATQAPTNTPTPGSNDPRLALGEPDWTDTFKNSTNWSLSDDEHVRISIEGGEMNMTAFFAEGRDSWILTWPQPENFYLEATFQPQACSGLDRYGFIIRSDASTGYLVGLSCDGQVSVRRWNGENFKALIDWTPAAPALAGAGQANRLGVMVIDDEISIYVNGILAGETSDDQFSDGGFGVFIGSKNTDDFEVDVSVISYWEEPK